MRLRVSTAAGVRLQPALELLYAVLPNGERAARIAEFQREIADGVSDGRELLLAELDGQAVGAALLVVAVDGTGLVWPPVVNCDSDTVKTVAALTRRETIEDALLQEVARRLDANSAWIGQALLEPNQLVEQAALIRNGFTHFTDLKFFSWSINPFLDPPKELPEPRISTRPPRLTSLAYRASRHRLRFANVIEQTYHGTLDCPELNGVRNARQALTHHAQAGTFRPQMWRLYCCDGQDVGVLLMVRRPEQHAWEIVYLGVVESARRRGVARVMLTDAQRLASEMRIEKLCLAVDQRNSPAIRLYESCGFRETAIRSAFIRLGEQSP